ncbi:unnamed protein product [Arabis nemorensis]|uniref:Phytocyanin domain-containing protein n=1 Tax=Arabis nemorensis TaxID=586526 RepID=A0A565AYV0_9BRAS|nr:unnamed protein product [Arabis nemorensis]
MEKKPLLLLVFFFFIYNVAPVTSDGSDHRYKIGDDAPLYANNVWPFHNPRIRSVVLNRIGICL